MRTMSLSGKDTGPLYLQGNPIEIFQSNAFQFSPVSFAQSGSIPEEALSGTLTPTTSVASSQILVQPKDPTPYAAGYDPIPSFIFLGGDVKYARDKAGNLIAGNPDKSTNEQ